MTTGKPNSRFLVPPLLLLLLMCPARGNAQASLAPAVVGSRLDLTQVLDKMIKKNAERADALQKYQGRRYYSLVYTGFPDSFHGEMVVDMTYEAPGTKQFKVVSQSGSQWIIDRVLKRLLDAELESMNEENRQRVDLNTSNYEFSGLEHHDAPDHCSYVVAVEPKVPSKLLYRGRIWLNSKDFAVCRIEAKPAKNPSFWIKKTEIHCLYTKIGDFWLPASNESDSLIRGGGRAVLTIKYQNYEILADRALKPSDEGPTATSLAPPIAADRPD
jgi:hypothetical protein